MGPGARPAAGTRRGRGRRGGPHGPSAPTAPFHVEACPLGQTLFQNLLADLPLFPPRLSGLEKQSVCFLHVLEEPLARPAHLDG